MSPDLTRRYTDNRQAGKLVAGSVLRACAPFVSF